MKKVKKVKLPQMHLVCSDDELRPSMQYVEVTKENVTATNAHVLVTHNTKNIFSEQFIEAIPDIFYIHRKHWAQLCKPHIQITYDDGLITQHLDGYKNVFKPEIEPHWKYPAWRSIIPNKLERQPIDSIGLSPKFFDRLQKAMILPGEIERFELSFFDKTRAILITVPTYDSKAIISMMITE